MDLSKISFYCKNEPAQLFGIEKLEEEGKIILPEVYKELLLQVNGFCTNGTISIYGTDDVLERYQTLEVNEYSPGYICIGDNGGSETFLMKQDRNTCEVLIVTYLLIEFHTFYKYQSESLYQLNNLQLLAS